MTRLLKPYFFNLICSFLLHVYISIIINQPETDVYLKLPPPTLTVTSSLIETNEKHKVT